MPKSHHGSRHPFQNVIRRVLRLSSSAKYELPIIAEFLQPAGNICGLVLDHRWRNSRLGTKVSGSPQSTLRGCTSPIQTVRFQGSIRERAALDGPRCGSYADIGIMRQLMQEGSVVFLDRSSNALRKSRCRLVPETRGVAPSMGFKVADGWLCSPRRTLLNLGLGLGGYQGGRVAPVASPLTL